MSADLPKSFSGRTESTLMPSNDVSRASKSRHLSVISAPKAANSARMTRGQVATRLNVSVSTVRRLEGERLHPFVDENHVRWFEPNEVAALAAALTNEPIAKHSRTLPAVAGRAVEQRTAGELAALVFERFEQRQSHAEIVIGLRVEPKVVCELFEQYCVGLTERQLRKREPGVPLVDDIEKVHRAELERRLAALPDGEVTRISVGRWRGVFPAGEDRADYAWIIELGGFYVSGPSAVAEIVGRYGPGSYRITAYGFTANGSRWEVLVEELA